MIVTKSNYLYARRCAEKLWVHAHRPEAVPRTEETERVIENGCAVGDVARGYFGEYVNVFAKRGDRPDAGKMIASTRAEMARGTPVICEAAFSANGRYCAVDILRKDGDGWAIYEVKSSTTNKREKAFREEYFPDVAFQKRVLEDSGVLVTGTFLLRLNSDYVRGDEPDVEGLFDAREITPEELREEEALVDEYTERAAELLRRNAPDPAVPPNKKCKRCDCREFCMRNLPSPSVFDLYDIDQTDALRYYDGGRGAVSFEDVAAANLPITDIQRMQVEFFLQKREPFVNAAGLRGFLGNLHYPLCFLDFETLQTPIPEFPGTRPYAQVPFLFSLWIVKEEGAAAVRMPGRFAEPGSDPRREIAENLCEQIPAGACVVAYNAGFEKKALVGLAEAFPDLSDRLNEMAAGIKDLLVPFKSGMYYCAGMNNFSIKTVLPALFPDDPEMDYSNLEGVRNGTEAMTVYAKMPDMDPEEREKTKADLIEYCNLDTFSLARIWEKLTVAAGLAP